MIDSRAYLKMRVVGQRVINIPQACSNIVSYKYIHGIVTMSYQDHSYTDEHSQTR